MVHEIAVKIILDDLFLVRAQETEYFFPNILGNGIRKKPLINFLHLLNLNTWKSKAKL